MEMETIPCPYCGTGDSSAWASERGFTAVRCAACGLLYVNPRPSLESIGDAVRTGTHHHEIQALSVVSRRNGTKVSRYRAILPRFFDDVFRTGQPISWLDVGAGYGEVMEAVIGVAPAGSAVRGLEPMGPKAAGARARGLTVTEAYLRPGMPKADVISFVDVFSHIPHFDSFLRDVRATLRPGGHLFLETGNMAELRDRREFPGELWLPDHLVFAGETHIRGYLGRAGFEVVRIEKLRIDTAVHFAKNIVKKLIGQPVKVGLPYTSRYRTMLVRAKLR